MSPSDHMLTLYVTFWTKTLWISSLHPHSEKRWAILNANVKRRGRQRIRWTRESSWIHFVGSYRFCRNILTIKVRKSHSLHTQVLGYVTTLTKRINEMFCEGLKFCRSSSKNALGSKFLSLSLTTLGLRRSSQQPSRWKYLIKDYFRISNFSKKSISYTKKKTARPIA